MKNNKGFTLVEMIVAVAVLLVVMAEVGALMVNSQRVYQQGYFELNLQENAQTIVTQVEDLLLNTTNVGSSVIEVDVVESTSPEGIQSDKLVLTTGTRHINADGNPDGWNAGSTVITVGRDVDLGLASAMTAGEDGRLYSTLYMNKDGKNIPIADGVHKMTVTKSHYDTGDVVTLALEMENHSYSYKTSSEVYLRNQPGTGGPSVPSVSVATGAQFDIDVLRVHTYNLMDYMTDSSYCFFDWDAGVDAATRLYYELSGSTLKCNTLNIYSNWNKSVTTALILASKSADMSDPIKINIHTDAVNDGNRMPLYIYNNTTAKTVSALPVTGICTCSACVNETVMDGQIKLAAMSGSDIPKVNVISWYPYQEQIVGYDHVDLALYKAENGPNFKLKHQTNDPDGNYSVGDEIKADEIEVGEWNNWIFQRSTGDTIDLTGVKFRWAAYTHIDGKGTEYKNGALNANYTEFNNNIQFPTDGGSWGGKYTLTSVHDDHFLKTANGFYLSTTTHATTTDDYYKKIVENNGYIRVHLYVTFKGLPDTSIYDTYAYFCPQQSGTESQKQKLWTYIQGTATDDPSSLADDADPADYGDYYN